MNGSRLAHLIAQAPLFSALPGAELEHLAATLQLREIEPGAVLMQEGECDNSFYILVEGEVEVVKALDTPDERQLAVKGGGTLFGEMSLFNPEGAHTASVRAQTRASVLEMTRQGFDALLVRQPTLVYELVRQMSQRLENSENATILDLREKNRQLSVAYAELQAAQAQLVEKERLEKELSIARQIQESILPDDLPQPEGYQIAALTVPARAVGGDYYDIFRLKGGRFGVVVGDACDKGIPAALLINLTNSLVHVEAPRNRTPEATLHHVNRHLNDMSRSGMFVSLLYGVLDPASGQFDYCRAGHPHPVVLDSQGQPVAAAASATGGSPGGTGMPLGIMEEIELDSRSVIIPAGGLAVLFSDGLTEAKDIHDNEFGSERLVAELPAVSRLPAADLCSWVWSQVQAFSRGLPQSDDFTVVVMKRGSSWTTR